MDSATQEPKARLVKSGNGKVHGYMVGYNNLYAKGRCLTTMCGKAVDKRGIDREPFDSTKITCKHCQKQAQHVG